MRRKLFSYKGHPIPCPTQHLHNLEFIIHGLRNLLHFTLYYFRLLNEERRSGSVGLEKSETETDCQRSEDKKVETEKPFTNDITLEENIIDSEAIKTANTKQRKVRSRGQSEKTFKCEKCDKNYKFASGLHYHNKHGHKDEKKQ